MFEFFGFTIHVTFPPTYAVANCPDLYFNNLYQLILFLRYSVALFFSFSFFRFFFVLFCFALLCFDLFCFVFVFVCLFGFWKGFFCFAFFTSIHRQTGCLRFQSDVACSSLDPRNRYLEVDSLQLCEVRRKN